MARLLLLLDRDNGLLNDHGTVSEAGKPDYMRFPAKPGHLPLGVIAMGLLHCVDRAFMIKFAV